MCGRSLCVLPRNGGWPTTAANGDGPGPTRLGSRPVVIVHHPSGLSIRPPRHLLIPAASPLLESGEVRHGCEFRWKGGAARLIDPVTDAVARGIEWGHLEKDQFTVPFGPWSTPETVSAAPWVWRYGVAAAATGSSYRALATRVHADVASREGGPVVVTLLSPWTAAYPFASEGYLDEVYVAEKLGRNRDLHPADLTAVTMLVRLLLSREESSHA